ncbi:MAG: aminopeptidase P family N-terminal domain-containing protein, partial [Betaproteobacteria bacterium]
MSNTGSVFAQRIASAQGALADLGLAACVVPSSDPHVSEYLPQRWQGREWLSGFTGSMGTLVLMQQQAALFADSRYWAQAQAELAHSGIELVKIDTGGSTQHLDWLAQRLSAGQ